MISTCPVPLFGLFITAWSVWLPTSHVCARAPLSVADSTWCLNVSEVSVGEQVRDRCVEYFKRADQVDDPKKVFYVPEWHVEWLNRSFYTGMIVADSVRTAVNRALVKKGLRKEEGATSANTINVRLEIGTYTFQFVKGGSFRFKVTEVWHITDVVSGDDILNYAVASVSELQDEKNVTYLANFNSAVLKGMDEMLEKADAAKVLKRTGVLYSAVYPKWEEIALPGPVAIFGKISEAVKSVVSVVGPKGQTSGSFVSTQGHIITSSYAFSDTSGEVNVRISDGTEHEAHVLRLNHFAGLALLKLNDPIGAPLPIDTARDRPLGEPLFVIGTPADLSLGQSIAKGILSGQRVHDDVPLIQTDAHLSPGNMGGPLTNEHGAMIGVIVGKFIGRSIEGLGFAVPVYWVERMMRIRLPH